MLEASPKPLTKEDIDNLNFYARILEIYTSQKIREFSPIGGRKIPKQTREIARHVYEKKERFEEILKIEGRYGCGHFRLEVVPTPEQYKLPEEDMFRPHFIEEIFPLKSDNQATLEYLADSVLPGLFTPDVFPCRKFSVQSNYVDAGW